MPKLLKNLKKEVTMLLTFKHMRLVRMQDTEKIPKTTHSTLEHRDYSSLQCLLRARERRRLSKGLTRQLVKDLTKGLRCLLGREAMHLDVKP